PLEGLWRTPDMSMFTSENKSVWEWTMMIPQPGVVTPEIFEQARLAAKERKPLEAVDRVRLERFDEGLAAQILHVGPYAAETPTIRQLHRFIVEQGYERTGRHHEIYLGDPRRAAPEKLKTIIRQPVRTAG
ncbi:MAG: GyrI-like domain-containing protein, partial [Gaiellaceae bacterium]